MKTKFNNFFTFITFLLLLLGIESSYGYESCNTTTRTCLIEQIKDAMNTGKFVSLKTGTYIVDDPIRIVTNGKNIRVSMPKGVKISGGVNKKMTKPILSFIGNENTTNYKSIIHITGNHAVIECLQCSHGEVSQAGTALSVSNVKVLKVSGIEFWAGSSGNKRRDKLIERSIMFDDGNGDSAITPINVQYVELLYNEFYGWDGTGAYISGKDYLQTDGKDNVQRALVKGNRFINNHVGMSLKRRFRYGRVEKNVFTDNFDDVALFPTENNGTAKSIDIINNYFKHTRRHILYAKGDYTDQVYPNGDCKRQYPYINGKNDKEACKKDTSNYVEDFDYALFRYNRVCSPYTMGIGTPSETNILSLIRNQGHGIGKIFSRYNKFDRSSLASVNAVIFNPPANDRYQTNKIESKNDYFGNSCN